MLTAAPAVPDFLVVAHPSPERGWNEPWDGFRKLPVVFSSQFAPGARAPSTGPLRYLSLQGRPIPPGGALPRSGVRLLPVKPGRSALRLTGGLTMVPVFAVVPHGEGGPIRDRRGRVAVSRSLPPELALSTFSQAPDSEAVSFLLAGPAQALPSQVAVISRGRSGSHIDALDVALVSVECPPAYRNPDVACATTPALRLSFHPIERNHASLAHRTLVGEVGGSILLRAQERNLWAMPVGAPEELEEDGPGRYRVHLRTRIVRTHPRGAPSVGADDAEAIAIARQELGAASRLWGQCGITLGPPDEWDIEVVDPPPNALLVVGCGGGFPASGGSIDLRIGARRVLLRTHPGESPEWVATRLYAQLLELGVPVRFHENPQIESAALPSFDLLLTALGTPPVNVSGWGGDGAPLSSDPSLGVCAVKVDLADGLKHFTDFDAAAGTEEERALLRGLMDEDPTSIDWVVVSSFAGVGRIGESFIFAPGVSIQNALVLDRMGLHAGARSFTLAHELGHILLALPGHPDDYGVDTPHDLMDSDAADSTVFGPRRLSLQQCRRVLHQSGRSAPVPLIHDWPLELSSGPP